MTIKISKPILWITLGIGLVLFYQCLPYIALFLYCLSGRCV